MEQAAEHVATQVSKELVALTKPRITATVVATAGVGAYLAPVAAPSLGQLVSALLGTALVVAAANALNMYLERDIDGKMRRTATRPLPAGRLSPAAALRFGVGLSCAALPLLTFGANPLTGLLGAVALGTYVAIYTPMKQRSWWALPVGAIAGAMPPLLGWTGVTGTLDAGGLVLFALLFLWQIPHFIAISLLHGAEYTRAGLKTLPAQHGRAAALHVALWATASMVLVTVAPLLAGLARSPLHGYCLGVGALLLGGLFMVPALAGLRVGNQDPSSPLARGWARKLFFASLMYLPLTFVLFVCTWNH
jgi:protoheme IX farnesyltransferase